MITGWRYSASAALAPTLNKPNMLITAANTEAAAQDLAIKLQEFISGIRRLFDNKISASDPLFQKEIGKLEDLARASEYDGFFSLPDAQLAEQQKIACAIFDRYETELEKAEAIAIVGAGDQHDFLSSAQLKRTFDFALEEARAMAINKDSAVCFVGGGYVPESAITISLNFHCPITVLDKNPEAVEISRKVIGILGLEKSVRIIASNAEKYDFGDADAVWVAVMAKDKNKIIDQIHLTNLTAKIACRTVRGSRMLLYEPVNEGLLGNDFKKREINSSNPETIMHSLILT